MRSLALVLSGLAVWAADPTPAQRAASGVNEFTLALQQSLPNRDRNLVYSGFSISSALSMTYAGARTETAEQMARALRLKAGNAPHAEMQALLESLLQAGDVKGQRLQIANAIWPQKGEMVLPEFRSLVQKSYQAEANAEDYTRAAEQARQEINSWVGRKTAGKIPDLLKPGMLSASTRMVLTNAIYFKGDWASPFTKSDTTQEPFTLLSGSTVTVPLMSRTGSYAYFEQEGLQGIELDYAGGRLGMVVILPRSAKGLGAIESKLTPASLTQWLRPAPRTKVILSLPRFKMESSIDMNDVLAKLGMTQAFTSSADFSGINGKRNLFLSSVVHKAVIEVNEEGTEAAAATGGVVSLTSMRVEPDPKVFRADHPFLFFLRDRQTGAILFAGRLVEPQS